VHLDVKPSNVLIAGDGLPMLLDFHLARHPVAPGECALDRLGGTPGWMAPEHRVALEAVSRGEAVSHPVDERADIFALGLLLREALCGPMPVMAAVRGRKSAELSPPWNPQVSVGLADIIRKCLAAEARDRYLTAAALAGDLRRHLNNQPLQGVANRSPAEAWRKWRRRRPAALSHWAARMAIVTALLVVFCSVQVFHQQRLQQIASAVENGRRLRQDRRFAEASHLVGQGLELASTTPAAGHLKRCLDQELALARRGQRAAALHELAERVRFHYSVDEPAPDGAEAIACKIGVLWSQRRQLLDQSHGVLDAETEASIRGDLLDLATTWAELKADVSHPDDGLEILDEAEQSCGESPQIELVRQLLDSRSDAADRKSANSALGHFIMGCGDLRGNQFREAASEFEQVIAERPQDFWPNFYLGLCAFRLSRFDEAHAAFRVCVALAPDRAECYFNRGRAAEAMGRLEAAAQDYSRAVELDPLMSPAFLNRGVVAYKRGQYSDAITDLKLALDSAAGSVITTQVQYNLALAYFAAGDRAAAIASAREAASRGHKKAAELVDRIRRHQ
jgi:tetratricopeptide (TPR) repeat protein